MQLNVVCRHLILLVNFDHYVARSPVFFSRFGTSLSQEFFQNAVANGVLLSIVLRFSSPFLRFVD